MPSLEQIRAIVLKISEELLSLDPGPLAELRRMEPNGPGAPIFWRLAAEHRFGDDELDGWKQVIRIMAILTNKGRRDQRGLLHQFKDKEGKWRSLGGLLCDGGNPSWPGNTKGGEPRPVLSETRLARFLAMPATQRGAALERIARTLSRSRDPKAGINCAEIAALLLLPHEPQHINALARDYYRRLDRATRQSSEKETA